MATGDVLVMSRSRHEFFQSADATAIARLAVATARLDPSSAEEIARLLNASASELVDWLASQPAPNATKIREDMAMIGRRCGYLWEAVTGQRASLRERLARLDPSVLAQEIPGEERALYRLAQALGRGDPSAGLAMLNGLASVLRHVDAAAKEVIESLQPIDVRYIDGRAVPHRVSGQPFAFTVLNAFGKIGGLPITMSKLPKSGTAPRPLLQPGRAMIAEAYRILRARAAAEPALAWLTDKDTLSPPTDTIDKWVRAFRSEASE